MHLAAYIRDLLAEEATLPPTEEVMDRIFELRHSLTAYDASYVALAEALGVPLLTDDAKFAGATGHRAEIQRHPR